MHLTTNFTHPIARVVLSRVTPHRRLFIDIASSFTSGGDGKPPLSEPVAARHSRGGISIPIPKFQLESGACRAQ